MQITVFGASGKVGQLVVAEAMARGYTVIAFCRRPIATASPSVTFFQGDIYDASSVISSLEGSEAVISTLGSWNTPKKDVLSSAMRHIIPAMNQHGIQRIVSITGADAAATGDKITPLHRVTHFLLKISAGKVLSDGEAHIQLLRSSNLNWTVVRSPIMNNLGSHNTYALSSRRPLPWDTIHRNSVAVCMLDQLESVDNMRASPFIARK